MSTFLFFPPWLRWVCLTLLLLPTMGRAQAPSFELALGYDSGAFEGVRALAVDPAGNTYFAGTFVGTQVFGTTSLTSRPQAGSPGTASEDVVVAKLGPTGAFLWATQLGSDDSDTGTKVAVDAQGDVYVSGAFRGYSLSVNGSGPLIYNSSANFEIFLIKLDGATGQLLWGRRAGGVGADVAHALAVNAAGDVFLGGSFGSRSASFGAVTLTNYNTRSSNDAFVSKLSAGGAWQWTRQAGGLGSEGVYQLVPDSAGALYVLAGMTVGTAQFGPATLQTNPVPAQLAAGGDVVVAKLTDQGAWLWAVQGDAVNHNNQLGGADLALGASGELYVVGSFQGMTNRLGAVTLANQSTPVYVTSSGTPYWSYPLDVFVARLSAQTGAWQWAVRAGGAGSDALTRIAADAQGRVYVTGDGAWEPNPGSRARCRAEAGRT